MKSVQPKYYGTSRRLGVVLARRHFNLPYTVVDRVRGNPTVPAKLG